MYFKKMGPYKLVSEPRFERFKHDQVFGLKPEAQGKCAFDPGLDQGMLDESLEVKVVNDYQENREDG